MLKHKTACDLSTCLNGSGRGVGALVASLANPGMTLTIHALPCTHACVAACRWAPRALSLSPPFDQTPPPAPTHTARVVNGARVLLLTRACTSLEHVARVSCRVHRTVRGHREVSRSQRTHISLPAIVVHTARAPQEVCGAALLQMHQHPEITSGQVATW